jgi:hypothetical protein
VANEFGKVHVGIVASTGGLVAGLNTASTSLQKFGVMARGAAGGATAGGFQALSTGILGTGVAAKIASFGVKSLTAAFGPLLIVFLAIRAITSIFGALSDATKRAEEVHKMSTALGISAKSYQALSLAAKEAGVEQGTLNTVLLKMNSNLGQLAGGSKSAAAAFKLIGMSAKDFAGLDADQSFQKIANAISKLPTPADQSAAALKILGKSGLVMLPALLGLNKALPETTKFLEQMGLVTKDGLKDGVAQIEEMGDALGRLKYPAQGFAHLFLKEIAPAVTAATRNFIEWSKTTDEGFSMATILGQGVAYVIRGIVRIANAMYGVFQGIQGVFLLIGNAAKSSLGYILKSMAPIIKYFGDLLTTVEEIGIFLINGLITPMKNFILLLARGAAAAGQTGLAKRLEDAANSMALLNTEGGTFGDWIGSFGDSFATWGQEFMEAGAVLGQQAMDLFGKGAQNFFNGLEGFDASVAASADLLGGAGAGLKKNGEAVAKAISASAAELKAIIVDSAAGETFRNDLVRGADPRLNEDHLKGIEANTEESASILSRIDSKFSPTGIAFLTA